MQYAQLIASEVIRNPNRCLHEHRSADQGLHNYLLYSNMINGSHIISNEEGWITTVLQMKHLPRSVERACTHTVTHTHSHAHTHTHAQTQTPTTAVQSSTAYLCCCVCRIVRSCW